MDVCGIDTGRADATGSVACPWFVPCPDHPENCPACLDPLLSGEGVKAGGKFFHLECWDDRTA